MRAWTFVILIILSACSMNLAGKQIAQPDMTCADQGGRTCSEGLLCTGELLDSFDGGLGPAASCCVLGTCEKALTVDTQIAEQSSLIATDISCNVHAYNNGRITVYASDLIRRGHYINGLWQEDPSLDISGIVPEARYFEMENDDYLITSGSKPQTTRISFTDNILRHSSDQTAISLDNGRWSYTIGNERVGFYFSTPYPVYTVQQSRIFFSDPQTTDRLIQFDKNTKDTSDAAIGYVDHPLALAASETKLFVADGKGIEVFDTENFRFLMRYPLLFKVSDLAYCGKSLYILGGGKLIKINTRLP